MLDITKKKILIQLYIRLILKNRQFSDLVIGRRRDLEEREGVERRHDGLGDLRRLTVLGRKKVESAAVFVAPVLGNEVQDVGNASTWWQQKCLCCYCDHFRAQ